MIFPNNQAALRPRSFLQVVGEVGADAMTLR